LKFGHLSEVERRPGITRQNTVPGRLQGLEYFAMQLWFAHGTEVTLREQLVTQVILGILCEDLAPGQRLPSTRDLARRFRLHPNTVSAGYRQLERERWVEFRRGSGVFVRDTRPDLPLSSALALDQLIANLFRSARRLGAPLSHVRSRLRQWLELQPPDHFLLIEPDEELRRIVALEMQQAVALPVQSCGFSAGRVPEALEGAIPVVLPSKARAVRQALPAGAELLTLQIRSVPSSLAGWLPAPPGILVGIASRWPDFLRLARTILLAAGFHPDALVFRDARKPNWQRGLKQTAAVVCDSVSAAGLPKTSRAVVFPLLSESSLAELRRYEEFLRSPLNPSV
jgi:DNA-binding transcriptional regulator YhcF (GntR family)